MKQLLPLLSPRKVGRKRGKVGRKRAKVGRKTGKVAIRKHGRNMLPMKET
jgi:hypothetical protein